MRRKLTIALLIMASVPVSAAHAQSLSPMKQTLFTYSDQFAMRLFVRNPYDRAERFAVRIIDDGDDLPYSTASSDYLIAPAGERVSFIVAGDATRDRELAVCVRSEPIIGNAGLAFVGEVCGRYLVLRAQ